MSDVTSDDAVPPATPGDHHAVTDYEQTVGVIKQLVEVRFKLAAFVPVVTGAAIAVIRANDIRPLTQTILALGGLMIALGVVVYDLRNSQIYNGAIGRAKELEKVLFTTYGGDTNPGLFGSRADSSRCHESKGKDRFLKLRVRHGTGLLLVYTATVTAWVWTLLDAFARRVDTPDWRWDWQPGRWLQDEAHASWVALGLSVIAAEVFMRAYRKHEPDAASKQAAACKPDE